MHLGMCQVIGTSLLEKLAVREHSFMKFAGSVEVHCISIQTGECLMHVRLYERKRLWKHPCTGAELRNLFEWSSAELRAVLKSRGPDVNSAARPRRV